MRGHRLHDLAVGDLANEIVERLLIFPDGERPEFSSERFCLKRVADDAGSGF